MKDIKSSKKTSFFKKLFIRICRKLGYEIIDQNSFEVVTSNKILSDDLSKLGLSSINLPLGEIKITRKVKALDIIIRTCASVNMLTQNKSRLFEEQKIEYTLRTIRSLLHSANFDNQLKKLKINFKVIDHNSTEENLKKIDNVFKKLIDLNPIEARISLTSVAANLNKFTTFSGVPLNFSRKASS